LEIREARPEDEYELRLLQESCPQGTTLVVSTVNIPDFFSRVRAYESYKVYAACEGGRIVGSAAVTTREILINGAKTLSGYEFQYFTSPNHRGRGIAKILHTQIESYLNEKGAVITSGLIMGGNTPSIRVAEAQGFSLHRTLLMHVLMVHKETNIQTGHIIRTANPGDLNAIADLMNSTWGACDFYEPVSAGYLKRFMGRVPGVSLENIAVIEEGGKIEACLGFQDWSRVMRITVRSLSFKMRIIGFLSHLLRAFTDMPGGIKPGDTLNQIMITMIAYNDPAHISTLLKYVNNFARKRGATQMFLICEPGCELSKNFRGFRRTSSKLYLYVKPLEGSAKGETLPKNPVFINGIDL
jgi:GNAT superfamily N-acetyltransferase